MTPGRIASAKNLLRLVRADTDAIGVAMSFGKDSLVSMDLCCSIFERIEAFYLFRIRNLDIVREWSRRVRQRFGVVVKEYPHFDLARCYRHSVLQPHWTEARKLHRIRMTDIERQFRSDAGIDWIAYGWRKNDSFSRAMIMRKTGGYDPSSRRVFPLRSWRRADVFEYLKARHITVPESLGRKDQGGLDFHPAALRYLQETYPEDYQRVLRDFPFAGVQLQREKVGP